MGSQAADQSLTKNIPMLALRASVGTIDEEQRTVELVFSTGAPVDRFDWWTGKRFIEKLSLKPGHVRLDRLNAGGPLLNSHSAYSLEDQIGVVVDGSVRMTGTEARATVRFSKRASVDEFWQDVRDGIIRNVSVGYRVHKFEEEQGSENKLPIRTATDWEPYEISMVSMPADYGAQTRSDDQQSLNPCVLVTRASTQEPPPMNENQPASESLVERNPLDPGAPTGGAPQTATAPEATDAQRGVELERERSAGITDACRAARMPTAFMDKLIKDGTSLVDAQRQVFEELRRRGYDHDGPQQATVRDIRLGEDPLVHVRAGIQGALLHRLAPSHFKLDDVGRKYRGMSLLDTAKVFLQARGERVTDLSKHDVAGMALGLSGRGVGMHSTSDFPNLLADVANKTLRRAYDEQPQTYAPLVTKASIPDFKAVNRVQFGDAPSLLEVGEHAEFKSGTISEGKETYRLLTYGRKFAITRQAIINDDTDAFARVPMMFGRKARILEANLVWAQITGNPTMGDGNALFSIAHANLAGTDAAIDITSLGLGRAALRKQTSLDGDLMNLSAKYLLVGPSQETLADQYTTLIQAALGSSVNPFAGRLQVIAEPRIEAAEPNAWYLAADPSQTDIIEVGYLDGEEGPMVESRVGFDIDGLEIKARLDFGTKVLDWRGLYMNEGNT